MMTTVVAVELARTGQGEAMLRRGPAGRSEAGVVSDEGRGELRVPETLLRILASFSGLAAFVWGTILLWYDETIPAALPYGYGVFSFATVAVMPLTSRLLTLFRAQLVLVLVTPFALTLALGGFVGSGAVVIWSLLAPIGMFLVGGRRDAVPWLVAYLGMAVGSALLDPLLRERNGLPEGILLMFFTLNIGAVSAIAFGMLYYFVGENERVLGLLQEEKEKSERLLLNVLPGDVAEVLRDSDQRIADQYEAVTVMFADVVGFTPISASLAPARMLDLLDEVFTKFDSLALEYGVEKIHTMGDGYLAVAGAPRRRPDHAQAVAGMALEMLEWLDEERVSMPGDVHVRIGINSGPVVAGVIGTSRVQYDVWGDTVNLASRMESQGEPGRIQLAPATEELLRHEFVCTPRGVVEVKGRGVMETWWLEGRRAEDGVVRGRFGESGGVASA